MMRKFETNIDKIKRYHLAGWSDTAISVELGIMKTSVRDTITRMRKGGILIPTRKQVDAVWKAILKGRTFE